MRPDFGKQQTNGENLFEKGRKERMKSENLYWIWLADRLSVASKRLLPLLETFGTPFEIFNLSEEELSASDSVSEDLAHRLADKSLEKAYQTIDYCTTHQIGILSYADPYYPSRLKNLQDPPAVLYYKGTLMPLDNKVCIAVVGTRKMSEYGKRAAYKMGYELAAAGAVVVSGMALGIDSVAACGAMAAEGKTIAVLGCGIDIVYPPQHRTLETFIERNGLVITEFAPGTAPSGANFPVRNRIISGLCQGTLIVEADEKSGAMITAKCALIQGRNVYAIPGNIDESNSLGTNLLIKGGATAVSSASDILVDYETLYGASLNYSALTYARSNYHFDEQVLEKMGVAARHYSERNYTASQPSPKQVPNPGELRPLRKPPRKAEEADRPSTVSESSKPPRAHEKRSDGSEEILRQLDDKCRTVFEGIPLDRAVTIDKLCNLGYTVGEVMAALTLLEIRGLISTLPGNLYIRR